MFLVPVGRHSSDFSRSIERLFDEHFFDRFTTPTAADSSARTPALDITETAQAYVVQADLPGVAREDVKVQIEGRRISLSAAVRQDNEARPSERRLYRERASGAFARSFTLPVEIDQSASEARLDNGVLTLTLAKRGAATASQLEVH
ncbi:Hsp20/alpha crystallin family protein [Ideonella sp. 4Y11]|uniref:Hsp20/alpha crystallin family protein n=1 Tax=Ideonella aquatica TaxID=2824119 RepID=A0A940YLS0_9BURK|nr:Hsp20/alpha crystallin family protein [Ideonella aquatica]MBQ0958666.1 Hsp20/alpha crystallin family protein [Ideonella aquatica]